MLKLTVLLALLLCAACSTKPTAPVSTSQAKAQPKLLSAHEAITLAEPQVKKWKTDAKLYSVSYKGILQTWPADPDDTRTWDFADSKTGKSRRWVLEFFSEKTLAVLFVDVLDGKVDINEASKFDEKPPNIAANFLDSTEALRVASQALEKELKIGADKYMALSKLRTMEDGKPAWQIEFYESNGNKALFAAEVDGMQPKLLFGKKA